MRVRASGLFSLSLSAWSLHLVSELGQGCSEFSTFHFWGQACGPVSVRWMEERSPFSLGYTHQEFNFSTSEMERMKNADALSLLVKGALSSGPHASGLELLSWHQDRVEGRKERC